MKLANICVHEIAAIATTIGINKKMIDNYIIKLSNLKESILSEEIRKRFNDLIFT